DELGFDYGISVDHVFLGYDPRLDRNTAPEDWKRRQEITLELAAEFLKRHASSRCRFTPMRVAQGWSPQSYRYAVEQLQKMGYSYTALGGMVPVKTSDILQCVREVSTARAPETSLHLLGVTRCECVRDFDEFGVVSFDSTSPLRQAFKDLKDNYYTLERTYSAIRVPQVEANPSLLKRIRSGQVNQGEARRLELECMHALRCFDRNELSVEQTLSPILAYERLYDSGPTKADVYRETLADAPWKSCDCNICKPIGINVVLFRGAERNRRRGFHNVFVFYKRLQR